MRRYLMGLLAAYAATMTVLAWRWSVVAWLYRRCFDRLMQGKHGRPIHYPNLVAIDRDFGMTDGPWVYWYLRIADDSRLLLAVVGVICACGLILPKYWGRRWRNASPEGSSCSSASSSGPTARTPPG